MAEPIRSCIVCRKRATKRDLLRLVFNGGEIKLDRDFRVPARGCYVHSELKCVEGLRKTGLIGRALRLPPNLPGVVEVIELIEKIKASELASDISSGRPARNSRLIRF